MVCDIHWISATQTYSILFAVRSSLLSKIHIGWVSFLRIQIHIYNIHIYVQNKPNTQRIRRATFSYSAGKNNLICYFPVTRAWCATRQTRGELCQKCSHWIKYTNSIYISRGYHSCVNSTTNPIHLTIKNTLPWMSMSSARDLQKRATKKLIANSHI